MDENLRKMEIQDVEKKAKRATKKIGDKEQATGNFQEEVTDG